MNTEIKRIKAISNAVGCIRKIEKEMGANYDGLEKILEELIDLTREEYFPQRTFPAERIRGVRHLPSVGR